MRWVLYIYIYIFCFVACRKNKLPDSKLSINKHDNFSASTTLSPLSDINNSQAWVLRNDLSDEKNEN